ncbi:substrate-binding domain-containing protein, partial [Listeria monocytogenes]|nr:substrate-binding domain-containing protein [Escherichia coli]
QDGEKIAHWFAETEHKPDAFLTPNDYFAAGLLTEARRLGYSVPEDFAICGFDNMEIAHLLDITTIHYPVNLQAENAFTLIMNQLFGSNLPLLDLDFHLVERKTT